jgi:hypothetical protein
MTPPDTQRLIDRLVAEAGPVRRLRTPTARLAPWLLLQAALAAAVLATVPRDTLARVHDGPRLLEAVLLAAAAVWLAAAALRAAVPGRAPGAGALAVACVPWALASVLAAAEPAETGVSLDTFAGQGLPCTLYALALASLPGLFLFIAIRRGAPVRPAAAGALAAAAALVAAHLILRLACPVEGRLHVLCWHVVPVWAGAAAGMPLGLAVLAHRRTSREPIVSLPAP